ncbi:MAG: TetR/AcrR family transcriptional regulator [Oscillospiraceae bacterium]
MDKRKEANLRVKANITNTLFSLMEKKSLADIHVSEIVKGAGVARASFYRNYCSKEDVLITLVRDVLEAFYQESHLEQGTIYTYDNVLLSFQYFRRYRKYMLDLYRSGFMSVVLEELNHFHENIEGNMPSSSIERYHLYMYTGALLNTALVWLAADDQTSPEDMARFFIGTVSRLLEP